MSDSICTLPNQALDTVFIYGKKFTKNQNSIVIKPNSELDLSPNDKFAIMFYSKPSILNEDIIITLTPKNPEYRLKEIFDTYHLSYPYPLKSDGSVRMKDQSFVMLSVKDELPESDIIINVSAHWANLAEIAGENDDDLYPPGMEIKVKPPQ